jgi:hypothetical protein
MSVMNIEGNMFATAGPGMLPSGDNPSYIRRIILPVPAVGKRYWYRIVEGKAPSESDSLLCSDRGRFHRDPRSEPTSYAGDSVQTAWLEHTQGGDNQDLTSFRLLALECPATLCDLRQSSQRKRHGITLQELRTDPPSERCREVASLLRARGTPGIVYSSNCNPEGTCVAIFLENTKDILRWHEATEEWERFANSKTRTLNVP